MLGSMQGSATHNAQTHRAYIATFVVFAINGLAFASWAARIPAVTRILDISEAQMGAVLLSLAVGSIISLPTAGRVSGRIGIANTVRLGGVFVTLGGLLLSLAMTQASLALTVLGLFLFGVGVGLWDVAQNVEGALVERRKLRTIMPKFHAAFSGGAFLGALLGAGLSAAGIGLAPHLLGIAGVVVVSLVFSTRYFLPDAAHSDTASSHTAEIGRSGQKSSWREPRTLLIGAIVLGATLTEGSANDWMAKATVDGLGQAEWVGAVVFAGFIAAMTVFRLIGGRFIDRWGRVRVLYFSLGIALLGLVTFVIANSIWFAGFGAILWGFGAALGFPLGMSAAADDPHRAARRVSVVSTIGYTGFLAGPPLIGLLAEQLSLRPALLVIAVFVVLSLFAVPAARQLAEDQVKKHET